LTNMQSACAKQSILGGHPRRTSTVDNTIAQMSRRGRVNKEAMLRANER